VLTILFGPAGVVAWPAVALVGWSRVRLRDHTTAQVVAGAAVGAATAAAVYLAVV
jgi:membrane-associated phospholipid phosphatase